VSQYTYVSDPNNRACAAGGCAELQACYDNPRPQQLTTAGSRQITRQGSCCVGSVTTHQAHHPCTPASPTPARSIHTGHRRAAQPCRINM
jgi:hypothetical protein